MNRGFSWSFSKLSAFETCPKRHYEVDVAKHFKDSTEQLDWGNSVHDALKCAVMGSAPLPPTMAPYQKWVNSVKKMQAAGFDVRCEQKYALTKDFQPCEYFGPTVWYRGVGDVVGVLPPYGLILDYKTGRPKENSTQLMLMAQCVFAFHPDVQECTTRFVWLKDGTRSEETYTRDQMASEWVSVLNRVERLRLAAEKLDYPPQPGKLCARYCPVTSCAFHGKRT